MSTIGKKLYKEKNASTRHQTNMHAMFTIVSLDHSCTTYLEYMYLICI